MSKLIKQEACQLYIEQEIEAGLAKGKTKYAIGKEIASWVEKLFGAKVNPNTIEQRAHRIEKRNTDKCQELDLTIEKDSLSEGKRDNEGRFVNYPGPGRPIKFADAFSPELKAAVAKEFAEEKRTLREEKRQEKLSTLQSNSLPEGKYDLIYADPPWKYDFSETDNRKIENYYPTMSVAEICDLDISSLAADDCVLFLWTTAPKLLEAIEVVKAWGFTYKTHAVWDKGKIGMGYWFRGQHELLFVGTKGNAKPPEQENRVSSVFREDRTQHSKKPICVYEWIEKAFPASKKLEIYCREPRNGWLAWGNELNGS